MNRNSSQRGGVLAGVLIAFLILGVFAVAGVFLAGMYFAGNIHVQKTDGPHGETVQVETPLGSMRVQAHRKLDPKLIGVPVYPGAIREDHDGGAVSFDFASDSDHKEFTILAAEYSTEDSVNKVKEYYRHEFPHWLISKAHHGDFEMHYTKDGYKRIIAISEKHGSTRIGLASIGEPASN